MENNNLSKYKKLIDLLYKSLGDRSWNQFAQNAGVDSGHLSRIKNGNFNKPPKPEFLSKLASKAHNGVTYEELMTASGYLLTKNDTINSQEITNNSLNIMSPEEEFRKELINQIKIIVEKHDIVEIKALKNILDGDYSLVQLRDTLVNFEKALQMKNCKKND